MAADRTRARRTAAERDDTIRAGLVPVISIPVHLELDSANGLLLAASPWLLGFAHQVCWPHVLLGLIEIGAARCTETKMAVRYLAPASL
jgi:hypothetical protein